MDATKTDDKKPEQPQPQPVASTSCWSFEYDVYLPTGMQTIKFGSECGTVKDVYAKADALGVVTKVVKRILVDGKPFREVELPRDYPKLGTVEDAIAYLNKTWGQDNKITRS